jgi:hypothetical protein
MKQLEKDLQKCSEEKSGINKDLERGVYEVRFCSKFELWASCLDEPMLGTLKKIIMSKEWIIFYEKIADLK